MTKVLKSTFIILFYTLIVIFSCVKVEVAIADSGFDISSKSAILIEYNTGEVLFKKDENEHLPVASMVKMMTILLALEELDEGNVNLGTQIYVSENASGMGGSQVFLDAFENYSFEDLLKSVIVSSANDASVALAEHFNGSEKAFVNRMNKRAKELSLTDTHYVNCTGLPAPEQYSSANDSAKLLKELLKHEEYHKYSTIWTDTLVHPSGRTTQLSNTNKLVRFYDGCDGGKTGSTNEAGCCLSASAKKDDMRLISVLIGAENSKTRFNETALLFNYGFKNFESKNLVHSDLPIGQIEVLKGEKCLIDVFADEDFYAVVEKGGNGDYETQIELEKTIYAPVYENRQVGKVKVLKNGQIVKIIPIKTGEDVSRISLFDTIKQIVFSW